ncbi:uncharacterized protein LOC141901523 [Tubulanus polymorphus]|uniref:uncharacterized protein LOC141901523 n=1 Tax=Tubulanus polymorphus TaxID=672921 RepID=UPI003DA26E06
MDRMDMTVREIVSGVLSWFGRLTVRDVTVFAFCVIILYLCGANERYAFVPRWRVDADVDMFANRRYPSVAETLPPPIVTDLESDGSNEVVVVTNEFRLRIYATVDDDDRSTYVLPEPRIKTDIQLPLNVSEDGRVSRPVAMATGYLLKEDADVPIFKQVIAIVTDDWNVLCYNHKLRLLWRTQLMDVGQSRDNYYIKSMQIVVASIKLLKKDEGLILVGGSFAHKIHQHAGGQLFGDDGLNQQKETHHNDDDSLTHFTTFALSATDGTVRWHHLPADFKQTQSFEKDFENSHHWKLALKRGHLHRGEKPWTDYRYDFLKYLPHSWTSIEDTKFTLGNIKRSSESESAPTEPEPQETSTLSGFIDLQNVFTGVDAGDEGTTGRAVDTNCLVVHSDHGVEVLNVVSGQPIAKLRLPVGRQTYADISGDGEIEEIAKKVRAASAATDDGVGATDCDAVVGKFKQAKTVFQVALCDPAEYSMYKLMTGKENFIEDPLTTIPPLVVKRIAKQPGFVGLLHHRLTGEDSIWKQKEKDLIFVTSNGAAVSYDSKGTVHWIAKTQSKWSHMSRIAIDDAFGDDSTKDIYRNAFKPTATVLPLQKHGPTNSLLVIGWDQMTLIDLTYGNILGVHKIPCVPNSNAVIGDFDNDGWSDVILVCPSGYLGFSINPSTNWTYAILLRVAVILTIALLSWCCTPDQFDDDEDDDDDDSR